MIKILHGIFHLSIFAAVVILFQNCAESTFHAVQGDEFGSFAGSSGSNPLVRQCISNVSQKMMAIQPPAKLSEDLASVNLTSETRLLAVVDNQCLDIKPGSELRETIFANQAPVSSIAQSSYELKLKRTFSFEDLANLAHEDPCILNIDLNVQMKLLQAAGGDPRVSEQRHLAAIEHSAVYGDLFNVYNGINSFVRAAATYHVVMSAGTAEVVSQKAKLIVGLSLCP